jgi:hypothetical protein
MIITLKIGGSNTLFVVTRSNFTKILAISYNRAMNTSQFRNTTVLCTGIRIITVRRDTITTIIRIATVFLSTITIIFSGKGTRNILYYTTQIFITIGFVTKIRRFTDYIFDRYTSPTGYTGIGSTRIIIVTVFNIVLTIRIES